MSYKKEVHAFSPDHADLLEKRMGEKVAEILRQEYGGIPSPIKQISAKIRIAPATIKNWYIGRNPPRLAHFLILARSYSAILHVLLGEIGGRDLQEGYASLGDRLLPPADSTTHDIQGDTYSAENCTIDFTLPWRISRKLNQRQIWFLGQLQRRQKVNVDDIVVCWRVSPRSAKSDIAGMARLKLIRFMGARRHGRYILLPILGDRSKDK